jgi:uncharacterized coiled-coil DUF342 family protein
MTDQERGELGEALVRVTEERQRYRLAWRSARERAVHHKNQIDEWFEMWVACAAGSAQLRAERDEARDEVVRLKDLVGDEDQPNWDGCSRAEAIRQANANHVDLLKWIDAHDARRAERDDARAEVVRLGRNLESERAAFREECEILNAELVRLRTIIGELGAAEAGEPS